VTEQNKDGEFHVRQVDREGPTGFITTTTAVSLHSENETRMISLTVTDTPDQTRDILREIACQRKVPEIDPAWHALQAIIEGLAGTWVQIPYLAQIAELVDSAAVRMRRDFTTLKNLIEAHCLLHSGTRERDENGDVVATLDDYEVVYSLYHSLVSRQVGNSVNPDIRAVVEAVEALVALSDDTPVTNDRVARHLKLHKTSISRRIKRAEEAGYLVNLEPGRGKPKRLVIGELLPGMQATLPSPEQLRGCAEIPESQEEITSEDWEEL